MGMIDAHIHVWTDDTIHYPLAAGPSLPQGKKKAGGVSPVRPPTCLMGGTSPRPPAAGESSNYESGGKKEMEKF